MGFPDGSRVGEEQAHALIVTTISAIKEKVFKFHHRGCGVGALLMGKEILRSLTLAQNDALLSRTTHHVSLITLHSSLFA